MTLSGKTAVVTGGGRGIGAAAARALAAAGASVVVAARTRAEIRDVAAGIGGLDLPCDVTKPASVRRLAETVGKRLGPVHILVNNAGIAPSSPLHKLTLAEWNRVMAVNATGALLTIQAFLPGMLTAGWGRIVNVASTAGQAGAPYIAAYAASKHALLGLTRSAAAEWGARGITVNAVCPGYVDTPLTEGILKHIAARTGLSRKRALAAILRDAPQPRLITPEEVARAILSFCEDATGALNGQALVLDAGGMAP